LVNGLSLAYRNPFVFRLPPMIKKTRARFNERQAERMQLPKICTIRVANCSQCIDAAACRSDQLPQIAGELRLCRVLELMGCAIEEAATQSRTPSPTTEFDTWQRHLPESARGWRRRATNFHVLVLARRSSCIRSSATNYRIGRSIGECIPPLRASRIEVELEYGPSVSG